VYCYHSVQNVKKVSFIDIHIAFVIIYYPYGSRQGHHSWQRGWDGGGRRYAHARTQTMMQYRRWPDSRYLSNRCGTLCCGDLITIWKFGMQATLVRQFEQMKLETGGFVQTETIIELSRMSQ